MASRVASGADEGGADEHRGRTAEGEEQEEVGGAVRARVEEKTRGLRALAVRVCSCLR